MRPLPLFLLAALALCVPAPAGSQQRRVFEEMRSEFYDVRGATAAELDRSIAERGPHAAGGSWAGYTHDDLRWDFRYRPTAEGCVTEGVFVRLKVRITLPRWHPPADAPRDLVGRWSTFVDALALHERGHHEISRRAAREVHDTLAAFRAPACDAFAAAVHAAGDRVYRRHLALQQAYDAETRHGLAQGAVRPSATLASAAPEAPAGGRRRGYTALVVLMLVGAMVALALRPPASG